jgi:hypothetical protein
VALLPTGGIANQSDLSVASASSCTDRGFLSFYTIAIESDVARKQNRTKRAVATDRESYRSGEVEELRTERLHDCEGIPISMSLEASPTSMMTHRLDASHAPRLCAVMADRRRIAWALLLLLLPISPASAELVPGATATATSELVSGAFDRAAVHTVDSSGLSGDVHATAGEGRFWESIGIGTSFGVDRAPAITFDLQEAFFLDAMRIWNFAEGPSAVRRAEIQVSLDLTDFSSLGVHTFATTVNPAQDINLNAVLARYVRLDVVENGGGTVFPFLTGIPGTSGFAGLGEVQFFGTVVPEPSTLMLIAIAGAVFLIIFRSHRPPTVPQWR